MQRARPGNIASLRLHGGALCLDFVNTVSSRNKAAATDYLQCFSDLLEWYARLQVVPPKMLRIIGKLAGAYPAKAAQVLQRGLVLRELLYNMLSSIIINKAPKETDIQEFNGFLSEAYSRAGLTMEKGGIPGRFTFSDPVPEQLLWWIVQSAAELLTSANLGLLRKCPGCHWLFLDRSKNRSRKWCSMETCGGLHKVKECYQRKKQERH